MPFGPSDNLLSHILGRISRAFAERCRIIVCTTELPEDDVIYDWCLGRDIDCFRGSPSNVSGRILQAAESHGFEDFLWVLGDNPWIDTDQMRQLETAVTECKPKFLVTPTPELEAKLSHLYYPVGTRLQYSQTQFFREQYTLHRNPDTEEHTSKLFSLLELDKYVLGIANGWALDEIDTINISINTENDYLANLKVLDLVGPDGSMEAVVDAYKRVVV